MQRRSFVLGILFALVVQLAIRVAESRSASQQRQQIQCDAQRYDFGKVYDEDSIEHTFKVTNAGQTPLQIKRVQTTCGCTAVNARPGTLQPGASTDITVRLSTRGMTGKVTKSVYVENSDPAAPNYPLTLAGEVTKAVAVTPSPVMFEKLDRKKPSTVELTLTNNTSDPMTLSNVTVTPPNVSATLSKVIAGKQYKLSLTAAPPYTESFLRGKVTLNTDLPRKPVLFIDFMGRPPSEIELQPPIINIGTLTATDEYTRTAKIISHEDTPFEITDVTNTNTRFTPVVRRLRDGREYEVEVTARPPYEWGTNRASISFGTRIPSAPRLTLMVYGEMPAPITISPSSLLFSNLTTTKGGEATANLKVVDGSQVDIISCKSSLANVVAKVQSLAPGRSFVLTATASPPFQEGQLKGEIILETSHPKMKAIRVPVQSWGIQAPLPAVSVIPDPVLTVPPLGTTGTPTVSRFIVRANGSEKVRVTGVQVSNREITTRIEPQSGQEDKLVFVYVSVPANAPLNAEGETITFSTDHRDFPKIVRRITRVGSARHRIQAPSPPTTIGLDGPSLPPVGGTQ